MAISLLPKHLGRYRDIALLLWKYGRSDVVRQAGLADSLQDEEKTEDGEPAAATEFADDLEKLGPTFIKLGQLLSTRSDLLPDSYVEALARLQDDVEPFSYEEVETILSEQLNVRPSKAFATFEEKPLAAASLGQVHRATLRDGREVVVKVQRPGIRAQIKGDLEVLTQIAGFLDEHTDAGKTFHFTDILKEFSRSLARELDYLQEAANLHTFRRNLAEFPLIIVPAPIDDFTSSTVLTMERVHGHNISRLSPVVHLDVDGEALAEQLFNAYLKQVLVDGVFHADPHPGNVLLTTDGKIGLIDLGMTGHVSGSMQDNLLRLLLAISEGNGETVAEISMKMGEWDVELDKGAFTSEVVELVAQQKDRSVEQTDVGQIVMRLTQISGAHGVRQPVELTMLAKALLNLHSIGAILAPGFNPSEAIREHAGDIMRRRALRDLSPANLMSQAIEFGEFARHLPGRLNRLFDRFSEDQVEIRIKAIDEERLISGLEKIANRITLGLVLAALIIGAALLMRVESDFRVAGYPALPAIFFVAAALGGVVLIRAIIAHDRADRKGK